jgi:ribonuclease HII
MGSRLPKIERGHTLIAMISRRHESRLQKQGYLLIAGVDEAGRGPLAGPVVAAACILPPQTKFRGLNDSKQLDANERERLFHEITTCPGLLFGLGICDVEIIDQINILQATLRAMCQAVGNLPQSPDYALIDGNRLPPLSIPMGALVEGDAKSVSIAAASILAKVTRDRMMISWDEKWPEYGFAQHKGYGTPEHLKALEKLGPCPLHRRSFAPVRQRNSVLCG